MTANAAMHRYSKEMPPHWKNEWPGCPPWMHPIMKFTFAAMCMISFGSLTLQRRWDKLRESEKAHEEYMKRIADRILTLTVVVRARTRSSAPLNLIGRQH